MRAKFFKIQELVYPSLAERGEDFAWQFLRPDAVASLDKIREKFGPCTVNNYLWGGLRTASGLRPLVGGVGAAMSLHRFGAAFDVVPHKATPVEVYEYILTHQDQFPLIKRLENAHLTKTWLHFDVANTQSPTILTFNP